jgi:peptide/nickel transport system substrate-binding protein
MRKVFWIILASLILSALILGGCSSSKTTTTTSSTATPVATKTTTSSTTSTTTPASGTPQYGGTLRILCPLLPASPTGWPPATMVQDTDWTQPAVETLLRTDVKMTPLPQLAKEWTVAPDKKSLTLKLQQNVKFHDGTDFDAEAAKFNLDAVMAAKVSGTTNWTSVDVVDKYTIKINLSAWSNVIYNDLAGCAGRIVSPTTVKTKGVDWAGANPVGTGPFTFVSYEKDTTLKYKRFDNYWQKGKPYLDAIVYNDIPDSTTQVTAFLAGEAEELTNYSAMPLAKAAEAGYYNAYRHDGVFSLYPDSANSDSPLSNLKVRQAIEYAIDKAAIVKVTGFGIFEPAYQLMVPGSVGNLSTVTPRKYDVSKAKQLMAEAGYANGFSCTLSITIPAPDIKDAQVAIQNYLSEIGIKCTLEYADAAKYADYIAKGWHNTLIYTPAGGEGNLCGVIQQYFTIPGYYVSLKAPTGLLDAYKEALSTVNVDIPTVEKAGKILYDDLSMIPVSFMGTGHVWDKKKVFGLGFMDFAGHSVWTPENTWLAK